MLKVENLSAWYGQAQALRGVNLQVEDGQLITLVGRNGAGKTTTLRSIIGLHKQIQGRILLDDAEITHWSADKRAREGLGYVQDDRGIFSTLSVEENLLLPPIVGAHPWSLERIYDMFPVLKARRKHSGAKLSGGEQQMLAIARVLRMGARVLLLDEPTEGLAPLLVQQIGQVIREAKKEGLTILLVEQNLRFAAAVAEKHYLLAQGQIVETLNNAEVKAREQELLEHLGI